MNLVAIQPPVLPQSELPTDNGEARCGAKSEHKHGSDQEFLSAAHISVKEGARRLNRSPSTVYHMDRNNGPFPIVKIGWRVWIELAGLEAFIEDKQCALAVPCIEAAQSSTGTEDMNGSAAYSVVPAARTVTSFWLLSPGRANVAGARTWRRTAGINLCLGLPADLVLTAANGPCSYGVSLLGRLKKESRKATQ